jgi:hypothetical protein
MALFSKPKRKFRITLYHSELVHGSYQLHIEGNMNKIILSVLSAIGILALVLPAHAQAQRPFNYFDAGQFMEFTNNINNLKNFSPDGIKAEFASGRQLFVTAGATPQVLASYDTLVKTSLGLPLFRDYSGWTQAQQDTWNKSVMDSGALDNWLGTDLNTEACFFFWLGNKTALLGKTVPSEFDWGNDLATAQGLAKPGLQKFAQFAGSSPAIFQTLQPPVQAAVRAIAGYNAKANNLSRLDITDIQKQASVILLHASNHTLTK